MTTNPPEVDVETAPLNLHDEYSLAKQCGYDTDLTLSQFDVQDVNACLRGVNAIAAVLLAESMEAFTLDNYIRSGMIEAVGSLTEHAQRIVERVHDHAKKVQASRNPQGGA